MLFTSMRAWFESSLADRLGPLETQLLRLLWEGGPATVRELIERGPVDGAYTTVMTTLDRLYKKGLLERTPEGRAFRYAARHSKQEFQGQMLRRTVAQILGDDDRALDPISCLVEAVSEHDGKLLDELEKAIERKRRQLKKGGR